jgi:crossover junction endodeoxyribonuclease RusA
MGITLKELKAQCSDHTAALNADVFAGGAQLRQAGDLGGAMPELAAQSIILALPPSANVYWRYTPSGVYVSEEAQNYKKGVQWKAAHQGLRPMDGPVAVYLNVYRARKAGDLDNFAKVLCDSLNGVAYHDDDQVTELHMWRHDDKNDPRVEVEIRRVTP